MNPRSRWPRLLWYDVGVDQRPVKLDYGLRSQNPPDHPQEPWPRWVIYLWMALISALLVTILAGLITFVYEGMHGG